MSAEAFISLLTLAGLALLWLAYCAGYENGSL